VKQKNTKEEGFFSALVYFGSYRS